MCPLDVPIPQTEEREPSREKIAIALAFKTGAILAELHPEIADDCRKGETGEEIALNYDVPAEFGLTLRIAMGAVYHAIKILLSEEERNDIRKKFASRHASTGGGKTRDLSLGIHSLSPHERRNNSIKGGKAAGLATYEKGIGIFKFTREEARKIASMAGKASRNKRRGVHALSPKARIENGKKGALAQGKVPWNSRVVEPATLKNEGDYCLYLATQQEFFHKKGPGIGRPNYAKIAEKLNDIFHFGKIVRTRRSACKYVSLRKKEKIVAT